MGDSVISNNNFKNTRNVSVAKLFIIQITIYHSDPDNIQETTSSNRKNGQVVVTIP